jgi:hypothetical protein
MSDRFTCSACGRRYVWSVPHCSVCCGPSEVCQEATPPAVAPLTDHERVLEFASDIQRPAASDPSRGTG